MSQALVTANFPLPSVVGSLDAYISAVHRIPVLTVEEEQALSRDYRGAENLDAAKKLVMSHLSALRCTGSAPRCTNLS